MHVLHRPHLAHVAVIAGAGAALAVVLTLLLAVTLNDFGFTSTFGSPAAAPTNVRSTSTEPTWNLNPFTSLLRAPAAMPWPA